MSSAGTPHAILKLIVCRQQLCICRWGFVHLMLCRAAGQERNQMQKAMTYEVRPVRLKKNMSKPNWCTTCGPFVKPFAMGTLRSDVGRVDFQMCLQALTYVREGVCTVGAGVSCLLSWLKKFKCWFSLSTLSISLFTVAGIINPLLIHSSCLQAWITVSLQYAAHHLFAFQTDIMNKNI